MNITIRTARITDAAAIANLSNQLGYKASLNSTTENFTMLSGSTHEMIYVAEEGNEITGWIQVSFFTRLESGSFFEIVGLVVDERYRSRGIGKQLITQAKVWCREKGNYRLRVRCNIKRADAHRFYINAGFREVKEQKVFEADL